MAAKYSDYLDALQQRGEQALFTYGVRAGLPWPVLNNAVGAAAFLRRPMESMRRRVLRHGPIQRVPRDITVPRSKGFRFVGPGDIPELPAATAVARELVEKSAAGEISKKPNNPFFPLLRPKDAESYPALLDLAMSDAVIGIATDYFGAVPRLYSLDVWLTRPNMAPEGLYNSQLWHLDKPDAGILTLFVNLSDVKRENGPFEFLPADVSRRVRRTTEYDALSVLGDGRLNDEAVFKVAGQDDLQSLVGPPGTAAFVDTSVCLHYGSRCRQGERWLLSLRFGLAHRLRFRNDGRYSGHGRTDPVRKLVAPGGR